MPQIKSKFTTEERIAFEEKYNLGVYSHEAIQIKKIHNKYSSIKI